MPETDSIDGRRVFRFDEIATIVNDRVDDPSEANVDYYVGLEHLDSDSLTIRRWGSPSEVEATKLRFRAGDIIFGRRRAYQRKLGVAPFDGICSAHAMVLRAKPHVVLPEFLPFFMQSDLFMERAREISVGSLSPTINWKTLAREKFALPSPEEQRRIARVLNATLNLTEAVSHQLVVVQSVLAALIVAFDASVQGRMGRLSDIVTRLEAGSSPAGMGRPASDEELGVLKVSAVGDWFFLADENKVVAPDSFEHSLQVKAADILATRANADPESVGRTCIVEHCREGLMLSDKTWRLVIDPDCHIDPYAVLAWTKGPRFRAHVRNHLSGTDAKNISQAGFLSAPVPVGEVSAFNHFGTQVRALLRAWLDTQDRLETSRALARAVWADTLNS